MNEFDLSILSFLNQFAHRSVRFDHAMIFLSRAKILKGGVIVAVMWWVWFEKDNQRNKREALLAATIASIPAVLIARLLSLASYRARPLVDPRVSFHFPYGMDMANWAQVSSFPSDHAVMFFALATGIFLASRAAGWFAFVYVSLLICVPRLYLGEHYATDVLAGAGIGIFAAWLCNLPRIRQPLTGWVFRWMESNPSQFYCCSFLLAYLITELFEPLLGLAELVIYNKLGD